MALKPDIVKLLKGIQWFQREEALALIAEQMVLEPPGAAMAKAHCLAHNMIGAEVLATIARGRVLSNLGHANGVP